MGFSPTWTMLALQSIAFLYAEKPNKVIWDANCCRTGLLHPLQPCCLCLNIIMHNAAGRFWMSRGPSTTWRARCSGIAASSCSPSPRRRWPSRQVGATFCSKEHWICQTWFLYELPG